MVTWGALFAPLEVLLAPCGQPWEATGLHAGRLWAPNADLGEVLGHPLAASGSSVAKSSIWATRIVAILVAFEPLKCAENIVNIVVFSHLTISGAWGKNHRFGGFQAHA